MTEKAQKQSAKTVSKTDYRERQLLLVSKTSVITVNSVFYRDTIKNALKTAKIKNILIITVTIFRIEASIVIITAEENTVKDLLKYKNIWESKLNLTQIRENKKWHNIILHILSINILQSKEDLKMLKEEVKLFNKELKLMRESVWLLIEENK